MVKKTMAKKRGKFNVEFGGISTPKKGTKLAVRLYDHLDNWSANDLRDLFTGSHLEVTLTLDPSARKDVAGQEVMDALAGNKSFESEADSNGFSDRLKVTGIGLLFPLDAYHSLAAYRHQVGTLTVKRVGDAKSVEDEAEEADGE